MCKEASEMRNTIRKLVWIVMCLFICFCAAQTEATAIGEQSEEEEIPCFDSLEGAGEFYRSQIVKRNGEFEFLYVTDHNTTDEDVVAIQEEAYLHTGKAKEGDSIREEMYGGCISHGQISKTENGMIVNRFVVTGMTFMTTEEEDQYVEERANDILSDLHLNGKSEYEKVRIIYDYVCSNYSYDYGGMDSQNKAHTAYGALSNGKCVCDGYALLLYRLFLLEGIDARVIDGIAGNMSVGDGLNNLRQHAWNIVRIDGHYYNLDATWDAEKKNYQYFLLSDDSFESDPTHIHIRNENYRTEEFYDSFPMASADNPYIEDAEGICGEEGSNLTWSFNKGTLQIDGIGKMKDYDSNNMPWVDYIPSITKLVVSEGVTSIGKCGFAEARLLKTIELPDSLREIGECAFLDCRSLKDIVVPDNVELIQEAAFYDCSSLERLHLPANITTIPRKMACYCKSLKDIIIPNKVKEIQNDAFAATGITEVILPENVSSIGSAAFSTDSLKSIEVSSDNEYFVSISDVLFSKDKQTLVIYPAGKEDEIYTMPENTKKIGAFAFQSAHHLHKVIFSDTLTSIDKGAFSYTKIQGFVFPDSLESIGDYAFSCIYATNDIVVKSDVDYGHDVFQSSYIGTITFEEGVRIIPKNIFCNCNITEVIIPDNIDSIESGAFSLCGKLNKVVIGKGVRTISNNAFSNDGNLRDLIIYSKQLLVDENSFENCSHLDTVAFAGSEEDWNLGLDIRDTTIANAEVSFNYHEHVSKNPGELIDSTCEKEGNIISVCDICGNSYISSIIPRKKHQLRKNDAIEATCIKEGCDEYYQCELCNQMFKDSDGKELLEEKPTMPRIDHSYSVEESKSPTCTEYGEYKYTCIYCGETKYVVGEEPHGHHFVEGQYQIDVLPTCTEKGKESVHCNYLGCNEIMPGSERDIPTLGHDLYKTEAVEATSTKDGNIEYWTCSECKKLFSTEDGTEELSEEDVVIKARGELYAVVVENGEGSGQYYEGETVHIKETDADKYNEFKKWEIVDGEVELDDINAKETIFTMPAMPVSIKALYEKTELGVTKEQLEQALADKDAAFAAKAEAEESLAQAQSSLEAANQTIADLNAAIESKDATIEEKEAALEKANEDLAAAQDALEKAQADLAAANEQIAEANETISSLQSENEQTQAELDQAKADLTAAQAELDLKQAALTQLNETYNETKSQLDAANEQITALQEELSQTQGELTQTQEQLEQALADKDAAFAAKAEAEESLAQAQSGLEAANQTIADLNAAIESKDATIEEKEAALEKANEDLAEAQDALEKAQEDLESANTQLEAAKEKISKLEGTQGDQDKELSKVKEDLVAAQNQLSETLAALDTATNNYNSTKATLDNAVEEIADLKSKLAEAEEELNKLKNQAKNIKDATIIGLKKYTYTGSAIKPSIQVKYGDKTLTGGTDYSTYYVNNIFVGTATVIVVGEGAYDGVCKANFKINKAANTLKVKAKTASVKKSKVKSKKQTLAVSKVISFTKKGKGKITYSKSKGNKKITINKKTGIITIKKGLKAGKYKIKVKVKAAGNANYKTLTKELMITIKVK